MSFNNLFWLLIGASYGGMAVAWLEGHQISVTSSYVLVGCLFASIPCAFISSWLQGEG